MAGNHPFSIRAGFRSFGYALRGVRLMLSIQHNAWIHAAFTVAVIVAGFLAVLNRLEWCLVVLAMMAVWTSEGWNTALEFLCDVASPQFHPPVEKAKDVAAAAVLMSAAGAVVIGVLVFGPHLMAALQRP